MPDAPETLEGWYALHTFRRIDWRALKALDREERAAVAAEAAGFQRAAEAHQDAPEGASAFYRVPGHKADLMFLHLRPTPDELNDLERAFARTRLADFSTETYSYLSVTELSLYEAQARGAIENPMDVPFVRKRLKPEIPDRRYVTFYPMNKRRGEQENWYMLPMEERRGMMRSHGTLGHKYAPEVTQMITGSVGLDDWEWGVTLFTSDPLQFKKLVYEMRFDEVSARFAEFGMFLLGIRMTPEEFDGYLAD
jgi:hydrogen peroxide-dependent heme synthase